MNCTHSTLEYKDAAGKVYQGDLFTPRIAVGQKLPGVVIFPTFKGITDFEKKKAKDLAKLGYIALAADPYGKGVKPEDNAACFQLIRPMTAEREKLMKPMILAGLSALKSVRSVDQQRVAAIGFCFGGTCALDLARYNTGIKAAVSYHGTLKPVPDLAVENIKGTAIQVHNGDADVHIAKDQVDGFHEEMRARNADFVFVSHANAVHGFSNPASDEMGIPGVKFDNKAASRSWNFTITLFKEVLHQ